MITTYGNVRFNVPDMTPVEDILTVANKIREFNKNDQFSVLWNTVSYYMVPRGSTFVEGRYPTGKNEETFEESIRAWFLGLDHETLTPKPRRVNAVAK